MNLKLMQLKVLFKMFKSLKVKTDKNTRAFLSLVRAGLWENCDEFQVSGSSFRTL